MSKNCATYGISALGGRISIASRLVLKGGVECGNEDGAETGNASARRWCGCGEGGRGVSEVSAAQGRWRGLVKVEEAAEVQARALRLLDRSLDLRHSLEGCAL